MKATKTARKEIDNTKIKMLRAVVDAVKHGHMQTVRSNTPSQTVIKLREIGVMVLDGRIGNKRTPRKYSMTMTESEAITAINNWHAQRLIDAATRYAETLASKRKSTIVAVDNKDEKPQPDQVKHDGSRIIRLVNRRHWDKALTAHHAPRTMTMLAGNCYV